MNVVIFIYSSDKFDLLLRLSLFFFPVCALRGGGFNQLTNLLNTLYCLQHPLTPFPLPHPKLLHRSHVYYSPYEHSHHTMYDSRITALTNTAIAQCITATLQPLRTQPSHNVSQPHYNPYDHSNHTMYDSHNTALTNTAITQYMTATLQPLRTQPSHNL